MSSNSTHDLELEIRNLLRAERTALLSGDLPELAHLIEQKSAAFSKVSAAVIPHDVLASLVNASRENQTLYQAAMEGLRAVQSRLRGILDASNGFSTYGPAGQSSRLSTSAARRDLRA